MVEEISQKEGASIWFKEILISFLNAYVHGNFILFSEIQFYLELIKLGNLLSDMEPRGLQNPKGANNCWLNATVQLLWHLDSEFKYNFFLT